MDKKKILQNLSKEDLQGFEEFIEAQPKDTSFLPKPPVNKKENSFEFFEFLTIDSQRLLKVKNLLTQKLPFISKYAQAQSLIKQQEVEIAFIKNNLFLISDRSDSPYRKSLQDVFNSYFIPPQNKKD